MRYSRAFLVAASLVCATGCGVVTANNRELVDARVQLATGDWNTAMVALGKRTDLCAILDRAVIQQVHGDPTASNAEFDQALLKIREYENRATVSATEAVTGGGSLLLNDKVLEYQGEGYEKVLIHTLKARNFLMLGDEQSARVEIRNANMRQDEERKRHQAAIDNAQKEAKDKRVGDGIAQSIDNQFAPYSGVLQRLDNVYQNPFATYLSAVVYELNGEPADAFVDLKNACQMTPNPLIVGDLRRIARKLHREDEIKSFRLGNAAPRDNAGDTLVFVDDGFAPERVEIKFPIPEPDGVLFAALPMTQPVPSNFGGVEVLDDRGNVIGKTEPLVDIEAMSVRNLRDRYPGIVVRQVLRLAAKAAAAHAAKKELGAGGELLSSVFNAVTEQADLRAWYGLPRSIYVARVKAGTASELKLRLLDQNGQPTQEVTAPLIKANARLNVVMARHINGQLMFAAPKPQVVLQTSAVK